MLKNIKALFFEEVEGGEQKAPVTDPKKPVAKPVSQKNETDTPSNITSAGPGEVNDKSLNILFGAMQKHNLEGFDYLEFRQSLISLEKMPMDEATRYKSALAMGKTMGATAPMLAKTADHYIKVLQEEEKKFLQAVANQENKNVKGRKDKVVSLDNLIKEKSNHIKKLTQEIDQHQKEMNKISAEIEGAGSKITKTKKDFQASFTHLVSAIKKDVLNIQKYLK